MSKKVLQLDAEELRKKLNLKDGEKGEKGDKGDRGFRGFPGKDGKDGKDGKSIVGQRGLKGDKGDKGDPGKNGKTWLMPNIKKIVDKELERIKPQIVKTIAEHSADIVMKNPELVGMPQFRAMTMGLRGDIDEIKSNNYIIGEPTKKITVSDTEPPNPSVGDLWVDIS